VTASYTGGVEHVTRGVTMTSAWRQRSSMWRHPRRYRLVSPPTAPAISCVCDVVWSTILWSFWVRLFASLLA